MGWGTGVNLDGRAVGYMVDAVCDNSDCEEEINRGLAYVCGGMHEGGDRGCGEYFCYSHLFMGSTSQLCPICVAEESLEEYASGK